MASEKKAPVSSTDTGKTTGIGFAVVAALEHELTNLTKGLPQDPALAKQGIFLWRSSGCVLVCAGMGEPRATLAVETALRIEPSIHTLVSFGFVGSCTADFKVGAAAEAKVVIDTKNDEQFPTGRDGLVLVTDTRISGVAEKAKFKEKYGAGMVDMVRSLSFVLCSHIVQEAVFVARIAKAKGLAFRAVKGVSDAHDCSLEVLNQFHGPNGEFQTGAFAFYTAIRPHRWWSAIELGKNSAAALKAMSDLLRSTLPAGSLSAPLPAGARPAAQTAATTGSSSTPEAEYAHLLMDV